ncbi:ras guanyl-releasing protein 3 isoform X2 [Lingula anatina]|uniref:Ras guanyl-releasing protein 3 isoform X2 n=1 Tax=Lingula anatina TaxID=7574 RepID=A0A1S3HM94_LINAN|nr:ras guanyl-releasing protein 3 isoform X2 [Lingula anatina]|eukprot:XP_013386601.1 ras guanyl-releasing protein 3 isoform X2 [Lingula anatina]
MKFWEIVKKIEAKGTTDKLGSCKSRSRSRRITILHHFEPPMSPKRGQEMFDNRVNQMRLSCLEDDRPATPVSPGIGIRTATIQQLVEATVDSFDENGAVIDSTDFPRVLFLMHRWFISSEELAQKLIEVYQSCDSYVICEQTCQHTSSEGNKCRRNQFKARVCHAVRYWINNFPVHFDPRGDTKLAAVVHNFEKVIQAEGNNKLKALVDISKVPSYDWMRIISVRNPSTRSHSRKVSLVFQHLQPNELAEQLTFLEYKAFRRITFTDFKNYAVQASLKDNPKLERSIALFNGLSQWVQCMVLSKTTPEQRGHVIQKYVNVARRLRELQNFNTLMAVVGGLTHSALARLSKTNACLIPETQKLLGDYTDLLSSSNNFSNYRKTLYQCKGFRIPILGVHLKDLISLNTAVPDRVDNLINFRKMAQLAAIFSELTYLQSMQQQQLPFDTNLDLANMLRCSLDLNYTDDDIYELSLAREPRNSLSSPPTPTKPVVFADWVAGISPPDPVLINKHVNDMVEAVFKNYDLDRDGFISHAEFEDIAGNFPFIDSFCVLDADQDGMISKAEMKTYFVRANCHALRNSFKHAFHETTYFKPTYCVHCTGLLWGLIKQGWKCKDCGINAHKHCKDLVVMECRGKQHMGSSSRSSSLSSGNGHGTSSPKAYDLTTTSKRKMSHRWRAKHQSTQTEECADLSPKNSMEEVNGINNEEFYEDPTSLYERLVEAEETRDKLLAENKSLKAKLENQSDQITTLKSHIGLIRQHTITFILDQMDTLHMQRDTEV